MLANKKLSDCTTRWEVAELLETEVATLTYFAYGKGKRYKTFDIPKKSGGMRTIHTPVGGLNNLQKKLAKKLEELYSGHHAVHGFVNKRSTLTNALPHVNKRSVLNIDLSNYFPSITASRIIGLLKSSYFKLNNEVASLIAALCTYEGALPQGAATSPILSNMISYRLDRQLSAIARQERVTYSRYADDITFSTTRSSFSATFVRSSTDAGVQLGETLTNTITLNYFHINQKKVRLHFGSKAKFVTGIKVNLKPNVPRAYVQQLRHMIHSWERFGLEAASTVFVESHHGANRSFVNVILGKLAYLKHVKGSSDLVYRRLYNRVLILQSKYDNLLPLDSIEDGIRRIFVIESGTAYGTGFILEHYGLMTCAHVINSENVKFFPFGKALFSDTYFDSTKQGKITDSEQRYDLTVLPISTDIVSPDNILSLAPNDYVVKTGDECRVLGFPQYFKGAVPQVIDVKVVSVQLNRHGILDANVDRVLISGNSGGPVLNSNNQLIGIVRTGAQNRLNESGLGSTFLPVQEIRKFLQENPDYQFLTNV